MKIVIGAALALLTLLTFTIACDAYCAELRLEVRVGRLEERVSAVDNMQPGDSRTVAKIPDDLNAVEQAVWAAEYVRVRAARLHDAQNDRIDLAIDNANLAVDDLRRAQELW
jgi:hypothetical protein